jgi:exopolysaccharide biosynthesis polyprenyl glycosylphosphotransferase
MLKNHTRVVDAGMRGFDLGVIALGFLAAYGTRDRLLTGAFGPVGPIGDYLSLLAVALLSWLAASWLTRVYGRYRTRSLSLEIARIVRALILVALGLGWAVFLSRRGDVSRLIVVLWLALSLAMLTASRVTLRLLARAARARGYNTRYFAVVGSGDLAREVALAVSSRHDWGMRFVGFVTEDGTGVVPPGRNLGPLSALGEILERRVVDEVIFAVRRDRLVDLDDPVLVCEEQGVAAHVCVDLLSRRQGRLTLDEVQGFPMLSVRRTPSDADALALKRAFDVVVSAGVLVLLSPLVAVIALAIRLDSRGPVLFRQRRVGLNGREFVFLKFRTMCEDAEGQRERLRAHNEMNGPVFKMRDDPRVTRVGRLLRRTSLDELPQFWNVLRGDMSVVGPRPPLPSEVREYARWQRRRLSVKPGITCVWQVSGRNEIEFERWMKLDLHYIDHWSLWDDLLICMKTIPAVLSGRGAR